MNFVFRPRYTSWLRHNEVWYSTVERRVMRHGSLYSVTEIQRRVHEFTTWHDQLQAH